MESTYRSWMACIHDKRWSDLPQYMHQAYEHGSTTSQPLDYQSFVAHVQQTLDVLGEDLSVTVDSVVEDADAQCLAVRTLIECTPPRPLSGLLQVGRSIRFFNNQFVWFADQKVSRVLAIPDMGGIRQQVSASTRDDGDAADDDDDLDRMGDRTAASRDLDRDGLKAFYASYIASINDDLSESGLEGFCQPTVVHNARPLSLHQYYSLINESSSAVQDMTAHIHTIVVDERSQRIAARLEWAGTPVKELAGMEPNGRAVRFPEHVIYQLDSGKIARVWAIVDWEGFRAQMTV